MGRDDRLRSRYPGQRTLGCCGAGIALVLVVLATALIGDALRQHGPGRATA
jgi:ABC-type dipeptide/oligopeptide/nickel transport system permease subunit